MFESACLFLGSLTEKNGSKWTSCGERTASLFRYVQLNVSHFEINEKKKTPAQTFFLVLEASHYIGGVSWTDLITGASE